ncbi:sensor histidine kinase [Hymenobacter coccineus]|uniref:sensor histidine kinase n=1 Tax=Hymenobacter coccineus TaxID=1908235 RepID=UPI0009F1D647|nr:histidine kinase [Hymenobacter coccineus]
MNRRRIALYHALGWALLIAHAEVGTLLNYATHLNERLLVTATTWLSEMALFYYCFSFIYPRYWRPGRGPQLLLGLLATPLVFGCLRYLLEEVLMPAAFGFRNYSPNSALSAFVIDDVYLSPPIVGLAAMAWKIEEVFRREKDQATQLLTQEKTQAELAFLKTQINPHFLYNTLNYLYAEAYAVSEPLAGAVLRLSDLMRYMLHEGPDGQVELHREVEYLENFLALHRLRFEDQFFVNFRPPARGRAAGGGPAAYPVRRKRPQARRRPPPRPARGHQPHAARARPPVLRGAQPRGAPPARGHHRHRPGQPAPPPGPALPRPPRAGSAQRRHRALHPPGARFGAGLIRAASFFAGYPVIARGPRAAATRCND